MTSEEKELDRLYESLTLSPTYVNTTVSPMFYKGYIQPNWWGRPSGQHDIEYRNSDGHLHRKYGPAYISTVYKYEIWYQDGIYHRDDGPAIILKNGKFWFVNGRLHRLDGPAVVGDGRPKEYWIDGQKLSPKHYKKEIERRKRKGLIK